MDKKLFLQALCKFSAGLIMVGVLVFLPAGTLHYWNGWLLMAAVFAPMPLLGGIWHSPMEKSGASAQAAEHKGAGRYPKASGGPQRADVPGRVCGCGRQLPL